MNTPDNWYNMVVKKIGVPKILVILYVSMEKIKVFWGEEDFTETTELLSL